MDCDNIVIIVLKFVVSCLIYSLNYYNNWFREEVNAYTRIIIEAWLFLIDCGDSDGV